MDIFDLSLEEFEKQVDDLLESVSEDELLKELIDNGLITDEYEKDSCYNIDNESENIWIHKDSTNPLKKLATIISKKSISDLMEAA